MQIGVITNPNSRKNRSKMDRVSHLKSIVGGFGKVHQTPNTEALKPVLREFLRERARFWVSDGGDGALHWMLRTGIEILEEEEFKSQGITLPATLPTNGGSIDFVAHNVGIEGDAESILKNLCRKLEKGQQIEEVEVDSMLVEGVEVTAEGDKPFRTLGFGVAAGGIGQRFFSKLDEEGEHTSMNIVSVLAKTVTSFPVALSPLRHLPGMPHTMRHFAREIFRRTYARVTLDGKVCPYTACTGIHIASMSLNLGGVLRFFGEADVPGQLHCIVGAPHPFFVVINLPRMCLGWKVLGPTVVDGPCKELILEAVDEDDLLAPIIDGESYPNLRKVKFSVGPRVRIPRVVGSRPLN